MQDWVYQTPIHNVDDLKRRLTAAWSGIQQSVIDKAIDQLHVRLRTWVKANGRHFEHWLWLSWPVSECFVSVFLSWVLPNFTIRFWCSSLWMSVRFVACLKRYSKGAENRCGGKYNTGFIAIFLRCITAKNYAKQPRIDKVIAKIKRVQFFWNTVYSCLEKDTIHVCYASVEKING